MAHPVNKGDDFTCMECGGTFKAATTHEVALKEFNEVNNTSGVPFEDAAICCDDCYRKIKPLILRDLFNEDVH